MSLYTPPLRDEQLEGGEVMSVVGLAADEMTEVDTGFRGTLRFAAPKGSRIERIVVPSSIAERLAIIDVSVDDSSVAVEVLALEPPIRVAFVRRDVRKMRTRSKQESREDDEVRKVRRRRRGRHDWFLGSPFSLMIAVQLVTEPRAGFLTTTGFDPSWRLRCSAGEQP